MKLTKANLEKHGWLFAQINNKEGVLIREHELNNSKWDVEVDAYEYDNGVWCYTKNMYCETEDTFQELIKNNPELLKFCYKDGDDVNFE